MSEHTPAPPEGGTGVRGASRGRQTVMCSSISVTSAAIGDRSERVSVTWAKSGCPLSFSMKA